MCDQNHIVLQNQKRDESTPSKSEVEDIPRERSSPSSDGGTGRTELESLIIRDANEEELEIFRKQVEDSFNSI